MNDVPVWLRLVFVLAVTVGAARSLRAAPLRPVDRRLLVWLTAVVGALVAAVVAYAVWGPSA